MTRKGGYTEAKTSLFSPAPAEQALVTPDPQGSGVLRTGGEGQPAGFQQPGRKSAVRKSLCFNVEVEKSWVAVFHHVDGSQCGFKCQPSLG